MKMHYDNLHKEYNSDIVTVNLLSKSKSPEKELKNVHLDSLRNLNNILIKLLKLLISILILMRKLKEMVMDINKFKLLLKTIRNNL